MGAGERDAKSEHNFADGQRLTKRVQIGEAAVFGDRNVEPIYIHLQHGGRLCKPSFRLSRNVCRLK